MKPKKITIKLTEEQQSKILSLAEELKISHEEIILEALKEYIKDYELNKKLVKNS